MEKREIRRKGVRSKGVKTKVLNLESEVAQLRAVVEELTRRVEALENARGLPPEKPTKCELPERAWKLLEKARDGGLLDEEWRPRLSRRRTALLAQIISEEVFGANRWKPFEELWGISGLQQDYQKVQYLNTFDADKARYTRLLV